MIICHPLKLIFIKSKKVAGTSFEIALSSYAEDECVITPISPDDENNRRALGYRTAQNHTSQTWPDGGRTNTTFYNHMTAAEVAQAAPADVWSTYRKVAIIRDPFDVMISRYFWEGGERTGLNIGEFAKNFPAFVAENARIAPLDGPYKIDHFLRYEALEEDIEALEIADLWARFSQLRAKGHLRPKDAKTQKMYEAFPEAADVVGREAQREMQHFGYVAPPCSPRRASADEAAPGIGPDYIFTITGGRTGSAWLAELIEANLGRHCVHEPLAVDDFGPAMPEIGVMRAFNTFGFDHRVRAFWDRKLSELPARYAETNHTLSKCGLVEALAESPLSSRTALIVLRRNLASQCASYVLRGDFINVTLEWQWYLSPSYRNIMIEPKQFLAMGPLGRALWYTLEMAARQEYYLLRYSHRMTFIEADLDELATEAGAGGLLSVLGLQGPVTLPPKANATSSKSDDTKKQVTRQIREVLHRLNFDPKAQAQAFIAKNRVLHLPDMRRAFRSPVPTHRQRPLQPIATEGPLHGATKRAPAVENGATQPSLTS